MRKLLLGVLVVAGVAATGGQAQAWMYGHTGPWSQTAAFPCANPPGWYTNTYSYAWQYPWFAYYNYAHGPYANWAHSGGYAYYANCAGHHVSHVPPVMAPGYTGVPVCCTMTVNVPADAKLLFNGTPANGTGAARTFTTPPLQPGQEYAYDLTAEVVRNGKTERVTERVVLRAGEKTSVTLAPAAR